MTLSDWLAERERLANAATKAPWYAAEITNDGRTVVDDGRSAWANDIRCETPDAAFIADARASLPLALAMVRVLSEAMERATEDAPLTDPYKATPEGAYYRNEARNALRRVEAMIAPERAEGGGET